MTWPPKIPKSMPQVWWDFFKAIFARIDAIEPKDGKGIRIVDSANGGGRSVNLWGAEAGAAGVENFPLKLIKQEEGIYRVVYGTVAGWSDPFSPGDDPIYTVAVANGNKVYANLSMSYNSGTGVWAATGLNGFGSAPAVPAGSETNAYHEIGSVSASGAPASSVSGSLSHKRCGDEENFADYFVG